MSIADEKNRLRKIILRRVKELPKESKDTQGKGVCNIIMASDDYKNAKIIFTYLALSNELSLDALIAQAMNDKKDIYVPKVINDTEMDFFLLDNKVSLEKEVSIGKYGIREPLDTLKKVDWENITLPALMIAPGVAFDKNGGRLGRGAGYYDRYIKRVKKNITLIGVCFREQVIDKVPIDKNDVMMDKIIFIK